MKWVGITGGLATGKSTLSDALRQEGFTVIDADLVARQAVEPGSEGLRSVINEFGDSLLNPEGGLDRQRMAEIVFSHPEKLRVLESILHPLVQAEVLRQRKSTEASGAAFCFYDVPLLFEKSMQGQFDQVVVVYAPRHVQIERAIKRNGWTEDEVEGRLQAQVDIESKREQADLVFDNSGSREDFSQRFSEFLASL